MSKVLHELPANAIEHLRCPNVVAVATVGPDGQQAVDLLSWVWPMDATTVRLVISPNIPGGHNLRANGQATLQLLDRDLAYEVRGTARLVKENCESVRFPEAMYDLKVEAVRANMFPATHLTGPIPYARDTGTEELHQQLDEAMYGEMRSTPVQNAA